MLAPNKLTTTPQTNLFKTTNNGGNMTKERILNKEDEILQFLFKETIINQISGIIDNLENNIYCIKDIKYLEDELKRFVCLSIDLLNINFNLKLSKITINRDFDDTVLGSLKKDKYLYYFKSLLGLFKNQL